MVLNNNDVQKKSVKYLFLKILHNLIFNKYKSVRKHSRKILFIMNQLTYLRKKKLFFSSVFFKSYVNSGYLSFLKKFKLLKKILACRKEPRDFF